jgi:hypothetical protein
MNTSVTQAGIIHSLIWTVVVIIIALIASKGNKAETVVPITAFFAIIFFSYIGWFPVWTGSIIAMVLVIFVGYTMGKIPGVT